MQSLQPLLESFDMDHKSGNIGTPPFQSSALLIIDDIFVICLAVHERLCYR